MTDSRPEEVHGPPDLLHLLTCSACRSWAIGRLLDRQISPPEDDDTKADIYAGLWERLEERTPEAIEQARARSERAEGLFSELMQAPAAHRLRLVRQPRFLNLDLVERLLEESHAGQLTDAANAAELARLAALLAGLIGDGEEEAAAARSRACSLAANARRLEGRLHSADAWLAKAVPFLTGGIERAFYGRTVALLRWEQGRTDEAMAMFQHAACLYAAEGLEREAGCCLTLLGLVVLEEGDPGEALSLLSRGWAAMDRDGRPLLAVRAGLALADCLAQAEQTERARHVLLEAWQLVAEVPDPREMARVHWLEGRALSGLGEREEAAHVLESVRRQLLAEPSPAEAALVSLDLALVLAESGRADEIDTLAEALWDCFPEIPALPVAATHLDAVGILAHEGEPRLREAAFRTAATLRRMFRAAGLRIQPLPIA